VSVTRDDIAAASSRLRGHARRTPVVDVDGRDLGLGGGPVALKLEYLQVSGSFKGRGAHNLLLTNRPPAVGVVAASGGNFGLAVAFAAAHLGHAATVFVPDSSPTTKADGLRALGADVRVVRGYYDDAQVAAHAFVEASGGLLAHPFDDPAVVAGGGTCALELDEQVEDLDTVIVAVGGGGLIGGTATWFAGDRRVVSVETSTTPTMHAALAAGRPVDVEVSGLAASALGTRRAGSIGFAAAQRWVHTAVLVEDDDLVDAQSVLWDAARIAVEPASAAPLAALRTGAYRPEPGERVALVLCGANVDPATLSAGGSG
jgi:threonine dehydratase